MKRAARRAILCLALFCQAVAGAAEGLSWSEGAGFRCAEVRSGGGGKAGFTLMNAAATGVHFTNTLQGDAYATNAVAHNGAGVAIGDVDGDGLADIYFCNLQGANRLYRNLGDWRFEEMNAGDAACPGQFSSGATFADVDGDADLDLLVNGIAVGTRLFLNDGKGKLTEAKDSGLSRTASATSLALADIDGDGDLDLYCTHYIDIMHLFDPTTRFSVMKRDGRWVVLKVNDQPTTSPRLKDRFEALPDGKVRELPEVHGLYRNDGRGHFTPIQHEPGVFLDEEGKPVPPYRDWGLAAMFRDINGDGAPDLYVCNDNVSPDRIWINSGRGKFRPIEPFALRHTSRSSMGVDFGDVDRDGHDDVIVVDMLAREHAKRMTQLVKDLPDPSERERIDARPQYNRNTLFFGRPDGTYAEAALWAGVAATDWSWCPIFIDVDLDGYEDLLVTSGFEADVMDQDRKDELRNPPRRMTRNELRRSMELYPRWRTAKIAFRNRRDGTFESASDAWGFNQVGISYGMALGDLDNDGDLDVVANNLNDAAGLYRNDANTGRVAVRLKGLAPNTQGTGARIRLAGGAVTQGQEMLSGGRYLSGDQSMRVFAAGTDTNKPMRLEVTWRNGTQSTITNVQANRIYEIAETEAVQGPKSKVQGLAGAELSRSNASPLFRDVSHLLNHNHHEDAFDDWARQPSLPRRISRLGPGVSWFDSDGDGWEDLIVTTGKGGKPAIYRNEKGQRFRASENAPVAAADQGAVLGWSEKETRKLLVAVSNYELSPGRESELAVYSSTNMTAPQNLPAGKGSVGPMAMADVDGDGDLDLFVGGRFVPGHYPEPASSALWINAGGELKLSASASEPFQSVGLVSGATFADLDGDSRPDLALALEWGPVKIFRNQHGKFIQWNPELSALDSRLSTLDSLSGWWTSVAAGDFDGDGKLDLAVGNWGRNTMYELSAPAKLGIFFGDWSPDGMALVEARQNGPGWLPVHNRTWLARAIPDLVGRFSTHQAFAKATLNDVLGTRLANAKRLEATELRSGVLLNRGARFEWMPLPREAQVTPAFSANVGDFDADGIEDLFLSQNCFSAIPEDASAEALSRDDSGRGLWLRGGGRGTFTAMDGSVTGIKVYGEQRGAALADFNHDGRIDLCVSQNNAATKLYLNESTHRGLRVTLHGTVENPDGIGAQMRVLYANGSKGPCRSVSAGTGYWSQDAAAQVLGCAEQPVAVWIRWPGGKEQTVQLEKNVWEVRLEFKNETN